MLGAESESRLLSMDLDEFLEALEDARALDALRRHGRFQEALTAARGNERQIHETSRRLLRTARVQVSEEGMGDVDDLVRDLRRA